MKKEIIAYITALIDTNKLYIENLRSFTPTGNIKPQEGFMKTLTCLLTFVEGIEEETDLPIVSCYLEEATLGRIRVKELEEFCETACEIEKNLQKKIEKLESDLLASEIISNEKTKKIQDYNKNTWSK